MPIVAAPRIAGTHADVVVRRVRSGGTHMPAFGQAALSDTQLGELAAYVHDSLGGPPLSAAGLGPSSLSPLWVGAYAWAGLFVLSAACAALFGHARN